MIALQATYGGPAVHKTEKFNPTEMLIRLIDENTGASRDMIERLFITELDAPNASPIEDQDRRRPCLKYFFLNAWAGLHPTNSKSRAKGHRQGATMRRAVAETVEQIKRGIVYSDLIMPNGKRLADCTGTEVGKFSNDYAGIAKIAGRRKVGAVLPENQLRKKLERDSK